MFFQHWHTTFLDFWPRISIPLIQNVILQSTWSQHPDWKPSNRFSTGPGSTPRNQNLPQIQTFRSGSYKITTFGNYRVSMNLVRQIWAAIKWISNENQHWITLGEGLPSWQRVHIPYDRRHFWQRWCYLPKTVSLVGYLSTRLLVFVPWSSLRHLYKFKAICVWGRKQKPTQWDLTIITTHGMINDPQLQAKLQEARVAGKLGRMGSCCECWYLSCFWKGEKEKVVLKS